MRAKPWMGHKIIRGVNMIKNKFKYSVIVLCLFFMSWYFVNHFHQSKSVIEPVGNKHSKLSQLPVVQIENVTLATQQNLFKKFNYIEKSNRALVKISKYKNQDENTNIAKIREKKGNS